MCKYMVWVLFGKSGFLIKAFFGIFMVSFLEMTQIWKYMAYEVRARAPGPPFRSSLHRRDVGRSAGRRGGIWGVKEGRYFAWDDAFAARGCEYVVFTGREKWRRRGSGPSGIAAQFRT